MKGRCAGTGPCTGTVRLGDGQQLAYCAFGPVSGYPVIALHGTPGSRLKYELAAGEADRLGLRLISPDRWGYGDSTLHPAPSLTAFAADMAAMADRLGIGRFAVGGLSGGGPYAAATAAVLGGRVSALALISPVGPVAMTGAADDLDAVDRLSFRVLPRIPGALPLAFGVLRGMLAVSPGAGVRLAVARAGLADRRMVCAPAIRESLARTFATGLAPGVGGAVLDMRLFSKPWDFDPGRIRARARIWIGTDDRNVPVRSARRLAGLIPNCELTVLEGQGHFWASRNIGEVLGWLRAVVER
jgi:pimeloyl-ACP methyl ester carboxylesterase